MGVFGVALAVVPFSPDEEEVAKRGALWQAFLDANLTPPDMFGERFALLTVPIDSMADHGFTLEAVRDLGDRKILDLLEHLRDEAAFRLDAELDAAGVQLELPF